MVLEKTLQSPLDSKEIQPVNPKGNQSQIFIGRIDAKAETPIFWTPDAKSWLIGKDPDAGKDWRQEETGATEDEMVGWHHRLDGHEFEKAPGVGDGQGSLVCCSPWGHIESDTTEQLNWTEHHAPFCPKPIPTFIQSLGLSELKKLPMASVTKFEVHSLVLSSPDTSAAFYTPGPFSPEIFYFPNQLWPVLFFCYFTCIFSLNTGILKALSYSFSVQVLLKVRLLV